MRKPSIPQILPTLLAVCLFCGPAAADGPLPTRAASQTASPVRVLPAPTTVSPELARLIDAPPLPYWNAHPQNAEEWRTLIAQVGDAARPFIPQLKERWAVESAPGKLGGVPVFTLTPKVIPPGHEGLVLLHIHGGGYVFHPGETGTGEGILMAGLGGFKVVSVDYRMLPEHPYPAALDDVLAAYKALLADYPPERIAVFGCSTGGGLTLALMLRAKAEGLPLPAAIAPGTPWTDMSKTGDSYLANEGLDNMLVSYDGWVGEAARLYANGHDLKDPYLSPVYGDVAGLPPALLTTGTRDLFLSNTVRMHQKLREAGVPAELVVFEGMSHAHYLMNPDAPETRRHFAELTAFFEKHLRGKGK